MAADFSIRPLRQEDRKQWDPLWQGYLAFYKAKLPDDVTEATWSRLMSPDEDPHGLCAVLEDGQLAGIVHYLFHRSTWSIGPDCYLQDLFVAPDKRKSGMGAALIRAVYERADAADAASVYWLTQHFNETARSLYDRIARQSDFVHYERM